MMTLFWGIIKDEYKPRLFDGLNVTNEDLMKKKELLAIVNKREVAVRVISSFYQMEEKDINILMNHYGITEIPRIIGSRTCEVTYYEAELRDTAEAVRIQRA